MESPFFRDYWSNYYPPNPWTGVEIPEVMNRPTNSPFSTAPRPRTRVEIPEVMNRQATSSLPKASRTGVVTPVMNRQTSSPFPKATPAKVVSIPVRFAESENTRTKATSAVKIQKVFRGFLVRKSVKKIVGIKRAVDEIERRLSEKETIVTMRRDAKERLKVNEMLMALLFRLDSIRGVDLGVRDFRKAVIKKAIMLQERVDAIVNENEDQNIEMEEIGEAKYHVLGMEEEPIAEIVDQTLDSLENCKIAENASDQTIEANDHVAAEADQTSELQLSIESKDKKDQTLSEFEADNMMESIEEVHLVDIQQQSESELIQGTQEGGKDSSLGTVKGEEKKKDSSRELMERMIEGNERLTVLVTELCERQALQSRLISSLSQRVGNLEKAFQSERSKLKKKKRQS